MAKLVNTFNKYFVLPLVLSILISISSSLFVTTSNLANFMNDETKTRLHDYSKKKTKPFIYEAHFAIQSGLQHYINFLKMVDMSVNASSDRLKQGETLVSDQFIRDSLVEVEWMKDNYEEYLKKVEATHKVNIAEFHAEQSLNTIIDQKSITYKQIQRELALIPQLKAFDKANTNKVQSRNLSFFACYVETNVMIMRPSSLDKSTIDKIFTINNQSYCKNAEGNTPDRLNFRCRPWFLETMNREFDTEPQLILTNPYLFYNVNEIGQTLCLFRFDTLCPESSPKCKLLVCIDISIQHLKRNLEELNSQIPGFFYTVTEGSLFPFYYPSDKNFTTHSQLTSYEFNIYSDYLNRETMLFNKLIKDKILEDGITNELETVYYSKNEIQYTMEFYTIRFKLWGSKLHEKGGKMYLVHVSNPEFYLFDVVNLDDNKKVAIGCLVVYFLILSGVIILISESLLVAIAKNIVRPVEHLNRVLKEESKLDNEEDNFLYRSKEVDELFTSLMDLREVFYRMEQRGDYKLLDFINARRVLNKQTNKQYLLLKKAVPQENPFTFTACHSNIGNVCLYLGKLDKAVQHLFEACYFGMNKGLRKDLDDVKEDFFQKIENDFVNAIYEGEKLQNISEDPLITEKLESRFPKLIHSSFLFYRQIREESDLKDFLSTSKQSIALFERTLFDYFIYAFAVKDHWKICNACLKITEFIFEFKCNKEELTLLRALFNCFLENSINLEYTSSLDYVKNYTDLLKSNAQDELQVFEVPSTVLKSRFLLCLANIFVKFEDFVTALEFIRLCEVKEVVQDFGVSEEASRLRILILNHVEEALIADKKENESKASLRFRGELVGFIREMKVNNEEIEEISERHFIFALEGSLSSESVIQVLIEVLREKDFVSVIRTEENVDLPVSRVQKNCKTFDLTRETVIKLFKERNTVLFDDCTVMKCIRTMLQRTVESEFYFVFGKIKRDFNLKRLDEELKRLDFKVKVFFESDEFDNNYENISVTGTLNGFTLIDQIYLFKEENKVEKYLNEFYEIS